MKQHYPPLVLFGYWLGPVLIVACHIGLVLPLMIGLSSGAWLWAFGLYWLRMLAITGIYHRLLTHRAYSAPAGVAWVGSIVAASAGQMGPNWWKGHHVNHHLYVEQDQDPHSATQGFWWAHSGWLLSKNFLPARLPSDLEQDAVLRTIDRLHFLPLLGLAGLSFAIGGLDYLGAFLLSTVLLFHGVAMVNSVCHAFGTVAFVTNDMSKNNWLVAILTLGEGWHNLHHALPWSARQGITLVNGEVKYLPDPTFWFIQLLQKLRLASQLRTPQTAQLLQATRLESPALKV
ncbi:MAG: acyl-CoA desaturase [Leptolyngbya sp. DLM2.Bin27]|nr:MAG: acyl-CoA desaturase [Leptolyngbya sp. DLM2.Bin27]